MNKCTLGTSVAVILVACTAPRPGVISPAVGTRLACAERLATALGFTDRSARTSSSVSWRRYRHEDKEGTGDASSVTPYRHEPYQTASWDELSVQATDSTVSVHIGSFPRGTVPSESAKLAADRIRQECGR